MEQGEERKDQKRGESLEEEERYRRAEKKEERRSHPQPRLKEALWQLAFKARGTSQAQGKASLPSMSQVIMASSSLCAQVSSTRSLAGEESTPMWSYRHMESGGYCQLPM